MSIRNSAKMMITANIGWRNVSVKVFLATAKSRINKVFSLKKDYTIVNKDGIILRIIKIL